MPTPSPIIVATELAQSGTSMTLASSAPPARPTPTPNSAVASGRPIATSDPNAISRMIAATSRPGPSAPMLVGLGVVDRLAGELDLRPRRLERRRRGRSSRSRRRPGSGRSCCRVARSRSRSCRRRRPGRRRRDPTARLTATMCGSSRTRSTSGSATASTPGDVTPASSWMTIVTVSPAWAGNRSSSSSMAAFESVPGDRNSCLFSPPNVIAARLMATRMAIHAATTRRRCRKDQEVMRFNMWACFRVSRRAVLLAGPIVRGRRDASLTVGAADRRTVSAKCQRSACMLGP